MAEGRLQALRSMVVAQATLFGSSATAAQVADFVDTGWLACSPAGGDPPPMPYDADALRALVASGRMG
jgi:hypothetical protein